MGKITTIVDLTVAAAEGDFEKVGGILAEEAKNKVAKKTTQKIQKQVESWKTEKQEGKTPVIPSPKKSDSQDSPTVIVNASLDKVKDDIEKRKIELGQNKLPIPERELIENNNKVTPVLKPKEEKPKEEEQKKISSNKTYTERFKEIDNDKHLLTPIEKQQFDDIVTNNDNNYLTTKGQNIETRESEIVRLEQVIRTRKAQIKNIDPIRLKVLDDNRALLSREERDKLILLGGKEYGQNRPKLNISEPEQELLALEQTLKNKKAKVRIDNAKVDDVIAETDSHKVNAETNANLTSKYVLTEDEALVVAQKWVNSNVEIGNNTGIYRSIKPNVDGTYNQYRMDNGSLDGGHEPNVQHIHLEVVSLEKINLTTVQGTREKIKATILKNNHIPVQK